MIKRNNVLSEDEELMKIIAYQKEYLDWFLPLTSEQKDFAVVALIKHLDEETLKKAKKWIKKK